MADPVLDQMTRLKLRLLEKRLENERENLDERAGTAFSTRSVDGLEDALHSALRRKRDLLQKTEGTSNYLKTRAATYLGRDTQTASTGHPTRSTTHPHLPACTSTLPAACTTTTAPTHPPPRIIQQMMPQQPATIIQQLPQQQPLITQIPPPQPFQPIRSGSIKEDMVELMLMQNAQMHQIIMHNMMLKAIPPMAFSPPGGSSQPISTPQGRESYLGAPITLRPDKPRGSSVHHHHHYSPPAPQLHPMGYPMWPPVMSSLSLGWQGPIIQQGRMRLDPSHFRH